jgi:hypothetical protein
MASSPNGLGKADEGAGGDEAALLPVEGSFLQYRWSERPKIAFGVEAHGAKLEPVL